MSYCIFCILQIILVSNGYKAKSNEVPPVDDINEDEENHFVEVTNAPKRERLCNQLLELIPAFGQLKYIQDTVTFSDLGNCKFNILFFLRLRLHRLILTKLRLKYEKISICKLQ